MTLAGNVLITGGAGFLGRSILRRIEREGWPARVTIYSRDETKQDLVRRRWPDVRCVLGDVRDRERLAAAMVGHDTVIHAAAMKYIPEAEHNVLECVAVNVEGSRNVAMAAIQAGVRTVVGLSTDKAAAPLNTYGMTKAIMERVFGEADQLSAQGDHRTAFVLVRYGNVVSSTGSVIPLFRHQLATLGEVQITDRRMTRFWLSADDAIDLITTAIENARLFPGGIFVPKCGALSVLAMARMVVEERDAAADVVPAAGHTVDERIREVGVRPGEKVHETLVLWAESPRTIRLTSVDALDHETPIPAFVIQPPIAIPHGDREFTYSSDAPAFWIEPQDMATMIADAATI